MTQFYAVLDANGLPTAFYSDDLFPEQADGTINPAIPSAAVAISDAVHLDCISNSGLRAVVLSNGVYVSEVYAPPAPAPVVPQTVSRRQLATQLAVLGNITQSEALAWLSGTLPSVFSSTISQLSSDKQFAAQMALFADSFDRGSTWTQMLGAMLNKSSADLDSLWTAAAALP